MSATQQRDFVGIDVYNLMFRAFHGNKHPLTHNGMPTNAIYTVCKMAHRILGQFNNLHYAVAAYDGGSSNFRKEIDAEYKANRSEMPEDLRVQIPYIEEAFAIMGFNNYKPNDFEADDALGCLGNRAAKSNINTVLMSGDKDFLQLVQPNLIVVNPSAAGDTIYDREAVFKKFNVYPEQIAAYLALIGDGIDNIRGVEKCGPKTAAAWLGSYLTLQGVIDNAEHIGGIVGGNLMDAITSGNLDKYHRLTNIPLDLNLQLTNKELFYKGLDVTEWNKFCNKLNFRSLILEEGYGKPSAQQLIEKNSLSQPNRLKM